MTLCCLVVVPSPTSQTGVYKQRGSNSNTKNQIFTVSYPACPAPKNNLIHIHHIQLVWHCLAWNGVTMIKYCYQDEINSMICL